MRILAFTCVKNEGPFLLEWLAYNRLIGVTDFLIFSNDCEDGTDALLARLSDHGVLQHRSQRATADKSVQWQALQKVAKDNLIAEYDWALFLDVDEFPLIHAAGHRLPDALAALPPEADALAMPWRLFGANGLVRFEDLPVTTQFLRSAPEDLFHPIAGRYIKTLFRPHRFQKPGIHRPKRPEGGPLPVWYDGAGQPLPEAFAARDGQIALPSLSAGRSLIELNHYALRSVESFIVKSDRGLANRRAKSIDLSYWVERNFNTVENKAITRWSAQLAREMSGLRALPGIDDLHTQACQWHRARSAALIRTEMGYRLYRDCLHAADSAVLSRRLALHLYSLFADLHAQDD